MAGRGSTASRPTGAMARAGNDFNVNFGDTIYSDSELAGAAVARTVAEKRAKYRLGLALAPLRQLRAAAGLYSGWDDHEFVNDFSRAEHGGEIYDAGVRAFLDYAPATLPAGDGALPELPLGQEPRALLPRRPQLPEREGDRCVRRRHRPDRSGRRPAGIRRPCPGLARPVPQACLDAIASPERTLLGAAQLAAFTKAIRASTATFKVVVNPVPLMQLYALPYDRWEGYAADRARVLDALRGVRNVVVLTTDTHAHLIGEVRTQTFGPSGPVGTGIWEVIAGPVATNTYAKEIDEFLGAPGSGAVVTGAFFKPQPPGGLGLRCAQTDVYGYAQVTVTADDAHGAAENRERRDRPGHLRRTVCTARRPRQRDRRPALPRAPRHPARQGADRLVAARPSAARDDAVRASAARPGRRETATARRESSSRCTRSRSGSARPSADGASICSGPAPCSVSGRSCTQRCSVRSSPSRSSTPRRALARGRRGARGLPPPADRVDGADRLAADRPGRPALHAYALEAALQEAFFVVGPLLAAALAVVEPTLAVGGAALASLVGTTALSRLPPVRRDAAVAHRGRRVARRARLGRRPHRRPLRSGDRLRVRLGRARDARVRGARGLAGARRDRARLLRGGQPARRSPRGDAPAARRCPPLPRRRARARRGPARAPARRVAPDARACSPSSPGCRSPRPSPRSTPRSTARRAREPQPRRSPGSGRRSRSGSPAGSAAAGALVEERSVRWAFGCGAAVALAGAGVGWLRRDTFRAERVSTLSSSARRSGDRAADQRG